MLLVWDRLGSSVRVKPFGTAQVLDPTTNAAVTVVQNGQSTSVVTADGAGRVSFVAQQGLLKMVSGGLVQLVTSPEAATQGAANAAAAQAAQAAAEKAASSLKTNTDAATATANTAKTTADTAKTTADTAKTTADATQAQQTQLMTVTPTVDELVQSVFISTYSFNGAAPAATLSGSVTLSVWTAPFACRIVAATLVFDYFSITADDTNYWGFRFEALRDGTARGAMSEVLTKVTGGQAIVARKPVRFAGVAWDANNSLMAEGDVLTFKPSKTGAPANVNLPVAVTFRYVPV